jgi:Spy/CpxP family protein refolding chaperone
MKKLILVFALFLTVFSINAQAQGGGDPAAAAQRFKDRVKPQLIEKTKLTDAQADKVIDINFNARSQMRGLRDLSDDDRKKKMAEIQEGINKEYKGIPLTEDQIKAVNDFFDEMRKNMQQQRQNGGGGGN